MKIDLLLDSPFDEFQSFELTKKCWSGHWNYKWSGRSVLNSYIKSCRRESFGGLIMYNDGSIYVCDHEAYEKLTG